MQGGMREIGKSDHPATPESMSNREIPMVRKSGHPTTAEIIPNQEIPGLGKSGRLATRESLPGVDGSKRGVMPRCND
jgi:hypothetical protein